MDLERKKKILKFMIEHANVEFINALYNKAVTLNQMKKINKKKSR